MKRVHIEFQRVQTWLFAVPRLRAMVGANVLLGEVLRVGLPNLARQLQHGSWQLALEEANYPSAAPDDPLASEDDPAADARNGILARDGGHFEAVFASGAENFVKAAISLLHQELPGLGFRISIDDDDEVIEQTGSVVSTELPVLAPCEWMGRGLASVPIPQGTERATVSLEVSRRHKAALRAENGQAKDLVSLLVGQTCLGALERARTFEGLAGDRYLALVYADGNGVGKAAGSKEIERARFFHRNRVLVRRAIKAAIDAACNGSSAAPLLPLMLGGDDLLVVCRADSALPFVAKLCRTLSDLQHNGPPAFELTLGVGVVIADPKIPIHRLHDVAERLAASAKRRYRGFRDGEERSVVDWAVYTTSWVDDPEEVRRRDWLRGSGEDRRVLSQRPLNVLGDGLDSLEGLLKGVHKLEGAPRSQLRYLVDQLPRGRMLSDLAFAELSKEARSALTDAGIGDSLWCKSEQRGPWMTALLDLVEVYEIPRLGRRRSPHIAPDIVENQNDQESAHAEA
jgi:hypothetical protein